MADININEYVRTEKGSIGKFKSYGIDDVDEKIVYFKNNKGTTCVDENEIVKHSPNIIDLIEVRDYVNGSKVIGKAENNLGTLYICLDICETIHKENDIKSIGTKEQFSNIESRLEE